MMNHSSTSSPETVSYPTPTQQRAERAAKCSPFRLQLFATLRSQSVALQELTDNTGIYNGFTRIPVGEMAAENELLWLLAVGLLRREVDGQGLTDSFRLTPLGRQLLEHWQASGTSELKPNLKDHLYNSLSRWLRLPGWLQS